MTDSDVHVIREFEAAGWELVADRYAELLSPIRRRLPARPKYERASRSGSRCGAADGYAVPAPTKIASGTKTV